MLTPAFPRPTTRGRDKKRAAPIGKRRETRAATAQARRKTRIMKEIVQMIAPLKRVPRGFTLIEVVGAIAVAGALVATVVAQTDFFARFNKNLAAASYQRQFTEAALRYWAQNPLADVTASTLRDSGFLPRSFPNKNNFGQTISGCRDPLSSPASPRYTVVASTQGATISREGSLHVAALLGPAAGVTSSTTTTLCGESVRNAAFVNLVLDSTASDNAYLARSATNASMNTTLYMGDNDIRKILKIDTNHTEANSGIFSQLQAAQLTASTSLTAGTLSSTVAQILRGALTAVVNATKMTVTSHTSVTNSVRFTQGVTEGGDCSAQGVGAIASPNTNDRNTAVMFCNASGVWQPLVRMNFRTTYSTSSVQTAQTAWCGTNEVVVSGGGAAYGSTDENIVLQKTNSSKSTQVYDPHCRYTGSYRNPSGTVQSNIDCMRSASGQGRECSSPNPSTGEQVCTNTQYTTLSNYTEGGYAQWSLSMTSDRENGNVKGNLRENHPVFSGRKWGWKAASTQPTFKHGERSASWALCLCLGKYDKASDYCTLEPGLSIPSSIIPTSGTAL